MKKTLTNEQVITYLRAIDMIIFNFPKMNAKVCFAILKANKDLKAIAEIYDEARLQLCQKYAEKDENGECKIKDNKYEIVDREAFEKELKTLNELTNEFDFATFSLDDLKDEKVSMAEMDFFSEFME